MPPEQARAIFKAMETELEERETRLATKEDLRLQIEQLRSEMHSMGNRLILWMFGISIAQATLLYTVLNRGRP